MSRQATIERNTNETKIRVSVNLDGTGKANLKSSMPFLNFHRISNILAVSRTSPACSRQKYSPLAISLPASSLPSHST